MRFGVSMRTVTIGALLVLLATATVGCRPPDATTAAGVRHHIDALIADKIRETGNRSLPGAARWQQLFPKLLAVIRSSNPNRAVIIGPGNWNNVDALPDLRLPENDRKRMTTPRY